VTANYVKSVGQRGEGLIYIIDLPYLKSECKEKTISIKIA
jgi:hypothetical protein